MVVMCELPYAAGLGPRPRDGLRGVGWVVFGAGGHARSVVDVLERLGESVVAVVGDADGRDWHVDVLEDEDAAIERVAAEGLQAVVAIGESAVRLSLLGKLQTAAQLARTASGTAHSTKGEVAPSAHSTKGEAARSAHSTKGEAARSAHSTETGPDVSSSVQYASAVVAASATVSPRAVLGPGTVVLEHAHVGPSARLGVGVIVNTAAVVEHDCVVGDGAHIAPGAALLGAARVGDGTFVGSGARVLPGIELGVGVTVGAGSVVTWGVPDGNTVVGVPARLATSRPAEDVRP